MPAAPNNKISGYTLIEMLLVITIIALIASLAIVTYRHQQQRQRIEKIALEMQSALSAALDYEADIGKWPTAFLCGNGDYQPPDGNFVNHYLPNQTLLNTIGYQYCWSTLQDSPTLFWLALRAPDEATAKQISAYLPNAIATSDPSNVGTMPCSDNNCFVRVEISAVASNAQGGSGFAGGGDCQPGTQTKGSSINMSCLYKGYKGGRSPIQYQVQYYCPGMQDAHLMASINFLDVGTAKNTMYHIRQLETAVTCKKITTNGTRYAANRRCTINITALRANGYNVYDGSPHGQVGASYTAYCSAKKLTTAKSPFYNYSS